MSLLKDKHINELFNLKHRNDDLRYKPMDVENNILKKSLSGHMYENDIMNKYLDKLQKLTYVIIDQMHVMKNFKNFLVDKYYYNNID